MCCRLQVQLYRIHLLHPFSNGVLITNRLRSWHIVIDVGGCP